MTEITEYLNVLPGPVQQFVLRWGDLGGQWGVNRSVAQIQALLYLSDRPMTAEDIADALGIARSNVSTSIRELIGWKLIQRVPILGDRRDHYEAEHDLWRILTRIARGRKEREIDPAIAALAEVLAEADQDPRVSKAAVTRLREMQSFLATLDGWFTEMLTVPPATLMALIRLGARVAGVRDLARGKKHKKGKGVEKISS